MQSVHTIVVIAHSGDTPSRVHKHGLGRDESVWTWSDLKTDARDADASLTVVKLIFLLPV